MRKFEVAKPGCIENAAYVHMCNLRNKTSEQGKKETDKKTRLLKTGNKLVVARGEAGSGRGGRDKGDQEYTYRGEH